MTDDNFTAMSQHVTDSARVPEIKPDFHGAAIIDEEGNEIPITEAMVQEAFEELEELDADNSAES